MNYYKRYLGDYQRKTSHLSLAEHGAYSLLLDHYYGTGEPLPQSMEQLYRLCRAMDRAEQAAVRSIAEKFFPVSEDGLRHNKRADEELTVWDSKAETSRVNGGKGGRPKKEPVSNPISNPQETQRVLKQEPITNLIPEARSQKPEVKPQKPDSVPSEPVALERATEREPSPVEKIFTHWQNAHRKPKARLDDKRRKLIRAALKHYDEADLCQAISAYLNSPHHMGQNPNGTVYDSIELFLRDSEHIDAGLKFYAEPPRTDLSASTRRNVAAIADWKPPELRNASS